MRRLCTAKRKNGEPCRGVAMRGSDKCRMHAGKLAAGIKLQAEAAEQLARLDVEATEDPLSELARVCAQVLAWKDSMAAKVNALTSLRYSTEGGEQLRSEIALWERALDRCVTTLTAMAKLNIDERLAKISEERAEMIITVFTRALEIAGVGGELADAVLEAADEEFARQAGVRL